MSDGTGATRATYLVYIYHSPCNFLHGAPTDTLPAVAPNRERCGLGEIGGEVLGERTSSWPPCELPHTGAPGCQALWSTPMSCKSGSIAGSGLADWIPRHSSRPGRPRMTSVLVGPPLKSSAGRSPALL